MTHKLEIQLEEIQSFINQQRLTQKEILSLSEAATYTGLSKSFLYKKTAKREIPFYKLEQKLIYFKKTELDAMLLSNRLAPVSEIADQKMTMKKGSNAKNPTYD